MNSFHLEIVTPDGLIYSDQVEAVLTRTTDGDVEILAGHLDLIAALAVGRTKIVKKGEEKYASSQGGFILVDSGKVRIVATTFEFADQIDVDRALRAKEEAERLQTLAKSDKDVELAEAKLKRALNRISVSKHR